MTQRCHSRVFPRVSLIVFLLLLASQSLYPATVLGLVDAKAETPWNEVNSHVQGNTWPCTDGSTSPNCMTEVAYLEFFTDQALGASGTPATPWREGRNIRTWIIVLVTLTIGFLAKIKPVVSALVQSELWRIFGPLDEY